MARTHNSSSCRYALLWLALLAPSFNVYFFSASTRRTNDPYYTRCARNLFAFKNLIPLLFSQQYVFIIFPASSESILTMNILSAWEECERRWYLTRPVLTTETEQARIVLSMYEATRKSMPLSKAATYQESYLFLNMIITPSRTCHSRFWIIWHSQSCFRFLTRLFNSLKMGVIGYSKKTSSASPYQSVLLPRRRMELKNALVSDAVHYMGRIDRQLYERKWKLFFEHRKLGLGPSCCHCLHLQSTLPYCCTGPTHSAF